METLAGAFQTPLEPSTLAYIPAMAGEGGSVGLNCALILSRAKLYIEVPDD